MKEQGRHYERRFAVNTGQEVRIYIDQKSSYALAKCAHFNWGALRAEAYRETLSARYIPFIEYLFNNDLKEEKPTPEEIEAHKAKVADFTRIFRGSFGMILRKVMGREGQHFTLRTYKDGSLTKPTNEQYQGDKEIFERRMQLMIESYARRFDKVYDDLQLVRKFVKSGERDFSELEELCKPMLRRFAGWKRVKGMDVDDHLQEGLLTIVRCAYKYEGRDFARFRTMLRVALQNRYKDLWKYNDTDKRRINRMAVSFEEDSLTGKKVDILTTETWEKLQRDGAGNRAVTTSDLFDQVVMAPKHAEEHGIGELIFMDDDQTVTDENFPYIEDREIGRSWQYWERVRRTQLMEYYRTLHQEPEEEMEDILF